MWFTAWLNLPEKPILQYGQTKQWKFSKWYTFASAIFRTNWKIRIFDDRIQGRCSEIPRSLSLSLIPSLFAEPTTPVIC